MKRCLFRLKSTNVIESIYRIFKKQTQTNFNNWKTPLYVKLALLNNNHITLTLCELSKQNLKMLDPRRFKLFWIRSASFAFSLLHISDSNIETWNNQHNIIRNNIVTIFIIPFNHFSLSLRYLVDIQFITQWIMLSIMGPTHNLSEVYLTPGLPGRPWR